MDEDLIIHAYGNGTAQHLRRSIEILGLLELDVNRTIGVTRNH